MAENKAEMSNWAAREEVPIFFENFYFWYVGKRTPTKNVQKSTFV